MLFEELLHLILSRALLNVGLILSINTFVKIKLKMSRIKGVSTF